MERYLVIVSQDRPELLETFASIYGHEASIEILFDRRRRQRDSVMVKEVDRRAPLGGDAVLQEQGFMVVPQPEFGCQSCQPFFFLRLVCPDLLRVDLDLLQGVHIPEAVRGFLLNCDEFDLGDDDVSGSPATGRFSIDLSLRFGAYLPAARVARPAGVAIAFSGGFRRESRSP